jgi:hypothetical protein
VSSDRMDAIWPDGRTIVWIPAEPYLVGDRGIRVEALTWMSLQRSVLVTPTGPVVDPDWADPLAAFTAVNTVAPGGAWTGAPDLAFGAPDDAVF